MAKACMPMMKKVKGKKDMMSNDQMMDAIAKHRKKNGDNTVSSAMPVDSKRDAGKKPKGADTARSRRGDSPLHRALSSRY